MIRIGLRILDNEQHVRTKQEPLEGDLESGVEAFERLARLVSLLHEFGEPLAAERPPVEKPTDNAQELAGTLRVGPLLRCGFARDQKAAALRPHHLCGNSGRRSLIDLELRVGDPREAGAYAEQTVDPLNRGKVDLRPHVGTKHIAQTIEVLILSEQPQPLLRAERCGLAANQAAPRDIAAK